MSYQVRNSDLRRKVDFSQVAKMETGGNEGNVLFYEIEPAEVLDIILDETHESMPLLPDGMPDFRFIGAVKCRLAYSQKNISEEYLYEWVRCLDSNIKQYPLKHEIILVFDINGMKYYSVNMNYYGSVNHNAVYKLTSRTQPVPMDTSGKATEYNQIQSSGASKASNEEAPSLGDTFMSNFGIHPIQTQEGDIVFNGRFGHSIKFGSNLEDGTPNIMIRNKQPIEVPEEFSKPIPEDINEDGSSIWITSTQKIPFIPATVEHEQHLVSMEEQPEIEEFINNQVIINSDRLIFNSKTDSILGFAKKSIGLVTGGTFTLDSGKKAVVNSPEIYLGLDAEEHLVKGETLIGLLEEIIAGIQKIMCGPYPYVAGSPGDVQLVVAKQKLQTMLSNQNFTL